MEQKIVVPTEDEVRVFDFGSDRTHDLIRQAQEADAADKQLTIKQALKKYPKAVFWSMILSTSLIMEGYDLVIASFCLETVSISSLTFARLLHSMGRHNSSTSLALWTPLQARS